MSKRKGFCRKTERKTIAQGGDIGKGGIARCVVFSARLRGQGTTLYFRLLRLQYIPVHIYTTVSSYLLKVD